jgi:tRNA(fMet)-specific endonuclease VapC
MNYLLDTNICIYIIKQRPEQVIKKFQSLKTSQLYLSSITLSELYYGAEKSLHKDKNLGALKGFTAPFEVVNFDQEASIIFGALRANLEKKGKMIGVFDLQIASIAMANEFTLVTNNEKEFKRIDKLKIENWV